MSRNIFDWEENMTDKLDKRMIGMKELLYVIKKNSKEIFRSENASFLSLTDSKNISCLELIISNKYWEKVREKKYLNIWKMIKEN